MFQVGQRDGVNADTLGGWCKQAAIDAGERPGATTSDTAPIKQLEAPVYRRLCVHRYRYSRSQSCIAALAR